MTCWVVRSLTLSLLWTVTEGDTEVSCVFMESCVLPCSFQPGHDVVIHWIKEPGNTFVHSYYYNQDQLSKQDQSFKGRTSLFIDQISRGNASLQLTGVKVQDQSRYKCYTSTIRGNKDLFISLKVDAPVTEVHIQQVENRIICSSERIYPEPELTWSTSPPSNMTCQNTTTVQQTEQQLYSISSTLIPPDSTTDVVYSCTISTRRNTWRATLNPSNTAVIAGVAGGLSVVAAIAGLTAFCV
uniref:V-set domain-containing T-cell activation inhibitor 1-like n=1 Tax=Scatophagus argus TaxID=75038 RepID=UPI001ED7EC29|nr:V-set domain-containing T-cell activation inhibitor 1-like [Scatophagus argus]XP_046226708.1 V-set domain-containing T-cell activation inhibitor 1-like [Scatophagus argus]